MISVTIISKEGRILAKEVNPLGNAPYTTDPIYALTKTFHDKCNTWQSAEDKLRTWEIANLYCNCHTETEALNCQNNCLMIQELEDMIGTIQKGEIISNNLIRIIQ